MKSLKSFFRQNRRLVSITGTVTLSIFLIFTAIALFVSQTPAKSSENGSKESSTTKNVADGDSDSDTDINSPTYDGEEDSCGEEDESSSEDETESDIDPTSLPYMIKVNRAANCLTVYKQDNDGEFTIPVKAITVSCGKNVGDTPLGTYQTINEYNWRKMVDGTYAQYAYRIVGPILFHSVPYYSQSKDDLEWSEYNKLGTAASLGCVRMTVADAKWLMSNCPIGTQVEIYDDAYNPGPLGKPETIKIPADSPYRGWDPTDPDPSNPWKQFSATINYPDSKVVIVPLDTTVDEIRNYVSATDTCGNDITDKIQFTVLSDFDTSAMGNTSSVMMTVTDAIGSTAKVVVTIEVGEVVTEAPTQAPTQAPTTTETTTEETTTEETTTEETTTPVETTTQETTTEETTTEADTTTTIISPSESSSTEAPSETETTTAPLETDTTSAEAVQN